MEISTYEAWLKEDRRDRERLAATHPEYVQSRLDTQRELDRDRHELLTAFPYSVVAEGISTEHDFAAHWCWQHLGPMHGCCIGAYTEYPACPLVLATEYYERVVYQGREWVEKRYLHPVAHEHQGVWTYLWFGKTDYDYGYGEYFFSAELDCGRFVSAFPTFTWSEAWNKENLN